VVVTQQASEVFEASERRALARSRAVVASSVVALLTVILGTIFGTILAKSLIRRGSARSAEARADS
jgi:ABC-type spermidine/putrescine transport system permease subunit II